SAGDAPAAASRSNCSALACSAAPVTAGGPAQDGRFRAEVPKFVRTAPGQSTDTPTCETPRECRLKCSVSVSATTACLDTPYGPSAPANTPKIDAVFTMCAASCSSSSGMKVRTPLITPPRLTPSPH